MKRLTRTQRARILALQVEGMSVRSMVRVTGIAKNTILKLITDMGPVCAALQGDLLRDLPCQRVQCDEIWAFVGKKTKALTPEERGEFGKGDVYTFTAICEDTKLAPTWLVGRRDYETAQRFLLDLGRRIDGRFQLTSDAASFYRQAVADAFGPTVDYAQLQKLYAAPADAERRYSPPVCIATRGKVIQGRPDPEHVSTSHVERQNLTMRMAMRRFTRLTNAFSKKVYNHSCAVAIHFAFYNFVKPHGTLTKRANGRPTTPAMAAGITTRPWQLEDLVAYLEDQEPNAQDISARRFDRETGYHGERL